MVQEKETQSIILNQTFNTTTYYFLPNPSKSIIVIPTIIYRDSNGSYAYNVTYKKYSWININKTLIIDQNSSLTIDKSSLVTINISATFKKQPSPTPPKPGTKPSNTTVVYNPNITLSLTVYQSNKI